MKLEDPWSGELHYWFAFHCRIKCKARAICGEFGEMLWEERFPILAGANRDENHELIMDSILSAMGVRAYAFYQTYPNFNTLGKLNKFKADILEKISNYVTTQCAGKALKYVDSLTSVDHVRLR